MWVVSESYACMHHARPCHGKRDLANMERAHMVQGTAIVHGMARPWHGMALHRRGMAWHCTYVAWHGIAPTWHGTPLHLHDMALHPHGMAWHGTYMA